MDFKALMTKLDTINNTQVLTESENRAPAKKSEREVELPSGAKVKATKVQGWQSQKGDKEADKEKKKDLDEMSLRSAIAQELLKEFNIAVEEEQELDEAGANPWPAGSPQATAWAALTPEDQKWLGGADPTDPAILFRAPNKGKPAPKPDTKDPTDPSSAAAVNGMDKASDDAAAAGAATKPAAPAANAQTIDPAKLKRFKELLAKAGQPAAKPAAKPATGAATKPAAPAAKPAEPEAATGMPGVDAMGNPTGLPMVPEEVRLADDQVLALIKGM